MRFSILRNIFSAKADQPSEPSVSVLRNDQQLLVRNLVNELPLRGAVTFVAAPSRVVQIMSEQPRMTPTEINAAFARAREAVADPNRQPTRFGRDFVARVNANVIAGRRTCLVSWPEPEVSAANQLAAHLMQARNNGAKPR